MKNAISLLMLLVVAGVVVPFVLPLKNGEPLLKFSDLTMPKGPKLPDIGLPSLPSSDSGSSNVTFYRWTDVNGETHIQNTPPPTGIQYETTTVNSNTNMIQSVSPQPSRPKASAPQAAAVNVGSSSPFTTTDPKQLMENINQLQGTMDTRTKTLDAQINKY